MSPEPCPAQTGQWLTPFQHDVSTNFPILPLNPAVDGTVFNAIQAMLIAKPPLQGWIFVLDHAPRQTSNPAYQRYALIKPSNAADGASGHVFHNLTFTLPGPNQRSPQHLDPPGDFFCSHHVQTQDGNVFLAGGTVWNHPTDPEDFDGSKLAYIWDPTMWNTAPSYGWIPQFPLQQRRYYPTVIVGETRADGFQRYYVCGGLEVASNLQNGDVPSTYEVYRLTGATSTQKDNVQGNHVYAGPNLFLQPDQAATFYWYPWLHLMSNGEFFMAGFARHGGMARHDPAVLQTSWNMGVGSHSQLSGFAHYGSSVLLPINFNALEATRDRVLRLGGRLGGPGTQHARLSIYWLADVEECAPFGSSETGWQPRAPLTISRQYPNAVILPDESILVLGGQTSSAGGPVTNVLGAERLVGDVRTPAGTMASPRDYHSIGLLLPDGRVFVGGGNNRTYDYQIYKPPYLSAGPRPVITSVGPGTTLGYDQTIVVGYSLNGSSAYVAKVVLMRPGSATHHFDTEQRLLHLQHVTYPPPPEDALQVRTPPNTNYAPKGYYMLFVVTNTGVPSEAVWVKLQ